MKNLKSTVTLLILFLVLASCKKAGADSATKTPPSNLAVNAVVSIDGTGKVNFIANADNAVSYAYEFGNGDIKNEVSGIINYQYAVSGTNTYTVTVTATSNSSLTVKKVT